MHAQSNASVWTNSSRSAQSTGQLGTTTLIEGSDSAVPLQLCTFTTTGCCCAPSQAPRNPEQMRSTICPTTAVAEPKDIEARNMSSSFEPKKLQPHDHDI